MKNSKSAVAAAFTITVIVVLLLSTFMSGLGKEKQKVEVDTKILTIHFNSTPLQIAADNQLPPDIIFEALQAGESMSQGMTLQALGITEQHAREKIRKVLNFRAEESSKNFPLILLKFALWALFLGYVFSLLTKNKVTSKRRSLLLFVAFLLFGVILGSDPNPMATFSDMISAYAIKGIFFPPRMIAFIVFLLTVLIANKFICGWACQFGTLQDFIYRLNRDTTNGKWIFKPYRIRFLVSNSIRISAFILFVLLAFGWAINIIEIVNPFNIYKPRALTAVSATFIAVLLGASLMIYRPWCNLFCPFGLVGWIIEKLSWHKIRVNSKTCISCKKCATSCPTDAMVSILKQEKWNPDCFACGECMSVCPTKSISFGRKESLASKK